MTNIKAVAEQILALLPSDGTPVPNHVMRVMLSRRLGETVTEERYAGAKAKLLEAGQIGRGRGQGGKIFLNKPPPGTPAAPPAVSGTNGSGRWSEAALMLRLEAYLSGPFQKGLDLPASGVCIVKDTSKMGPPVGRWARPDYILVTAMRFEIMPGAQVDVHSFELKAEFGTTDLAVYEALAQTRFTHFGHLVWHLPADSPAETRLPEILTQCDSHQIGLIRIYDPERIEDYEILLDPVRKSTLPSVVEGFLEARLNGDDRSRLKRVVNGAAS